MDDPTGPDVIVPQQQPKKTFGDKGRSFVRSFTTRDGLVGTYDYAYLFKPNIPFMKKQRRAAPFFGLDMPMPLLLATLLGFQHALAMLAGIITPPLILSGQGGVNLDQELQQYLVSTSLIVSAILSTVQITRFHIKGTPYYLGTGLLSVVGTSFAIIPVASGAFAQMYASGYCPSDSSGNPLPCPQGYGALIGTAACTQLLEVLLSFMPAKWLKKIFPPLVTGPTVLLIGVSLVQTGFDDWAGGSGTCSSRPTTGDFMLCPSNSAPNAAVWGSAQFIGLGFLVFVTIIFCERFGSPIMKSTAVAIGLLVGCIVAAATGYFSPSGITSAPAASFIWVHTFPLTVYGPVVLPLLAVAIVLALEATGDITATCDVSRLEVVGPGFDSRVQGGILADGCNGIIAALCTITPVSVFAQNNGVISLTRCASRTAGYFACFWLFVAGVFSKFAAALVSIPAPVLGGMVTFLFGAVAVSGMRIIATVPFSRRNRFVLTAALSLGFGATLVPTWFSYVFTYSGPNTALMGFFDAIQLVLETGFVVAAFTSLVLNLILPEEDEDEETQEFTANTVDEEADSEEWRAIEGKGPIEGKGAFSTGEGKELASKEVDVEQKA